jgi:hypothetical protein
LQVRGGPLLWWADRQDPTSTLFTLDDAAEEMEWESIDVGVTSVLEALNNTMGVLCDIVTPAVRVPRDPASWVSSFAFRISNSTLAAEEAASLRAREVEAHRDGDEAGEKVLALLQRARKDEEEAAAIKNKQDELFQRDVEAASGSSTS